MPSVTPTSVLDSSAATFANETSVGTQAWVTPANAQASDNTRTTVALTAGQQTQYLKASNWGFAIPTNAVILAIMVEIEKSRTAGTGTITDTSVRLVKRGVVTGINHASQGAAWTDTDAYSTYGDTDEDLWGAVWTAADINSFDFGVVFSCSDAVANATAGIDHIRITVVYQPGYDAAPQVQRPGEIQLGGFLYPLENEEGGGTGRVHETLATVPSPKIDTGGTVGRPSNRFVETVKWSDLRGGIGRWEYRTPEQLNEYWTGQSIDPLWDGATTLGPLLTSLGTPVTTSATAHHLARHTSDSLLVYHAIAGRLYNYDFVADAWSAVIDILPGTVLSPPVFANSRLFYAQGVSGYSYHTAADAVATDVATPTFLDFRKWDNKLYGIDTSGVLYSSPADGVAANMGNAANWTTLATIPNEWPVSSGINDIYDLEVYDDAAGDPIIYCRATNGLWSYDAVNDKWAQTRLRFPRSGLVSADYGQLGAIYRGVLYTQAGLRDVYAYDIKDPSGDDLRGLGRPDGLPAAYMNEIHAWATDHNLMYVLAGDSFEDATVSHILYAYNGIGWHPIHVATNPNYTWSGALLKRPPGAMAAIMMDNAFRLYFDIGGASGATYNTVSFIDLAAFAESPLQSTRRAYVTAGNIELGYYNAWAPADTKTAQQIRIKLLGAGATETVQAAFRINGSTGAYTDLGSAVFVNNEVMIPFGTGGVGLAFKSIQFRLTFASAGSTDAPKMEYFALDFTRSQEVLRAYQVRIDLRQNAYGRTPQQMYDQLYAALAADIYLTFARRDDADNTRSSVVKAFAPEGSFETGYDFSGGLALSLVEFGGNG